MLLLSFLAVFQTPAWAGSFRDVTQDYWAYSDIEKAYKDGVIEGAYHNGTDNLYFQPDSRLTMAQFLTMIGRAFYAQDMKAFANSTKNWYDPAWKMALKYQFVGYQVKKEQMEKEISRYEMAEILYHIFEEEQVPFPLESELRKTQDKIADFAAIAERKAEHYVLPIFYFGVLSGVDEKGTFAGERHFTRAEMAVIYARLNSLLANVVKIPQNQDFQANIVKRINEERKKQGRNPLQIDEKLNQAAEVRAGKHFNLSEHTREDSRNEPEILNRGKSYAVGMSIATGKATWEEVLKNLMSSESYWENMLSEDFSRIGVGFAANLEDTWVYFYLN